MSRLFGSADFVGSCRFTIASWKRKVGNRNFSRLGSQAMQTCTRPRLPVAARQVRSARVNRACRAATGEPGQSKSAGSKKLCTPRLSLHRGRGGKSTRVISRDNENSLAYFSISKKVPKKLPRRKTILRRVQVSTAKKLRTSCLPCARGGGFASAKPEGLFRAAK